MDLTRAELLEALKALDFELRERGLAAELRVIGGAAIALMYDGTRTTADVDSEFDNYPEVRSAIEATARKVGLPLNWINSQIHDLALPFEKDLEPNDLVIGPNLTLRVASPEFLLYTKIISRRRAEQDFEDALLLAQKLNLHDAQDILRAVEHFGAIDGSLELYLEEIAEELPRL